MKTNTPIELTPADEGILAAAYDHCMAMGWGDDDSMNYIESTIEEEVAPLSATRADISGTAYIFYYEMAREAK